MNPPDYLSDEAQSLWANVEEKAKRKLDKADYVMIEQLCSEHDIYRRAVEELSQKELESEKIKNVDPVVTVRNQAASKVQKAYKEVKKFLKEEDIEEQSQLRSVKNF